MPFERHLPKTYVVLDVEAFRAKIGRTTCLQRRLSGYQIFSGTLRVIGLLDGDEHERRLHERYKHLRIKGETFRYAAELQRDFPVNARPRTRLLSNNPAEEEFIHLLAQLKRQWPRLGYDQKEQVLSVLQPDMHSMINAVRNCALDKIELLKQGLTNDDYFFLKRAKALSEIPETALADIRVFRRGHYWFCRSSTHFQQNMGPVFVMDADTARREFYLDALQGRARLRTRRERR